MPLTSDGLMPLVRPCNGRAGEVVADMVSASPYSAFQARKPPMRSIGMFFRNLRNAISYIALKSTDSGEFASPMFSDPSS